MWISRHSFDTLVAERIKAAEEARVLAQQNAALLITQQWLRANAERWERERAHLLQTYMGVKASVPHFVTPEPDREDILGGANVFNDVGDEEAKRRGLDWDASGAVKQ